MCFTLQTPVPEDDESDWLPGTMGRAPIKAERQQEGEGEEEEDVTIINITPSQPTPAARKRSRGVEGPPGEGDHGLPLGGPPVTSPAGPDPLLMGALGHSLDAVSGRIQPVSSTLRRGTTPVLPSAPQAPAPLVPGGFRKPATPAEQAAIQAVVTKAWVEHQGRGRGASPVRGTPRPARGRSTGSPRWGRTTPRPQPLIPAPPLFTSQAPQGAAAGLALPAPSDTGSATPEALEERLLSEVPLERQSGRWHTRCTRPVVVWAPTDSQFQEAYELLAAVGRWHVPAWDYVHNPDHPKRADKAKSMRFPCPHPGCPKVLSKYLDLKGHFQREHIGGRTAPLCGCPSGAFNSASVFADHLDMIHNVQWIGVARGSRTLWRCYRDRKYASPSAPAPKRKRSQ